MAAAGEVGRCGPLQGAAAARVEEGRFAVRGGVLRGDGRDPSGGAPHCVAGRMGGWGWVLYKVLALALAIFMAQRGVGMVCKSMDYNRMRTTGA